MFAILALADALRQIEYSAGLAVQGGGFAGHGLRGSIRLGF